MLPEFAGVGVFEFRAKAGTQVFECRFAKRMFAGCFPGAPGTETVIGRIAGDPGADGIEFDISDARDDGLRFEDDTLETTLPKGSAAALDGAGAVEPARAQGQSTGTG